MSMYKIYIDNGSGLKAFYLPGIAELALSDIHYKPSAGSAGSLAFKVPATHPLLGQVHPLSTDFWLLKGQKKLFRGRYVGKEEDFYKTGKIECEGDLNFLIDSMQDPYEYAGGISGFFDQLLNVHNGMVEARKQFKRGIVNVTDENNYINRSDSHYSTTAEAFKGKLVKTHSGFLRVRHEPDGNYLDYVYDYGGTNKQVIRFGENLIDITKQIDATKIVTALIPTGAEVEFEDELGETQTRVVDIAPVNGGKKYIINQAAVDKWGMIWGTHEWKDVTLPENLMKKAGVYLEECAVLPETMELTALDLSLIDMTVDDLEVGYWTKVVSVPHGLSGLYMLYEMDINISDPDKSKISLGGKVSTLSGTAVKNKVEASRSVQLLAESTSQEINRKVENATTLITGGFGGYVVLDNIDPSTGKKMHPWRILVMNAPDKAVASNVIQINQNGIGFSTTGINGPYRNAWTIDGNLVADFVTTGTMLADRIRGGTLEVGGAGLGKDGVVMVKDAFGNMLCRIDKAGMQFYDGANNVTAVINKDGVDVRKGSIRGANLTLGGAGNNDGTMTLLDASGNVAAQLDKTGVDVRKGNIRGANLTLGGNGNADGTMVLLDTSGNVICSADNTGFKIYRGIVASYSPDGRNRSTVSDGSFKTWLENKYIVYLGEGGYENHGSKGSAVLWLDGSHGILLDANSGKITCRDIEVDRSVKVRDMDVRGGIDASGNIICTGSRIECSGDIHAKNVWCENLARYSDIEKLAKNSRVDELERRIAALGG